MVKSGNYNFENKTFILSVKYGSIRYIIERVASISLTIAVKLRNRQCYVIIMYNSGKIIMVFVRKKWSLAQTSAYTLTLLAQNARKVTQFP
jgi:hypothetical protein